MRKFYNRNVRVYLLFVMCLTWYIFAQFGGKKWGKLSTKASIQKSLTGNEEQFCKEDLLPTLTFKASGQYGFWYSIFTIQVIFQLIWILIDLKRDISKACFDRGGGKNCCREFCSSLISFCSASWIDLLLVALMVITLIATTEVLWLDLTILCGVMAMRELLQMASSLTGYVSNLGNRMDIALLSLVSILLYVPNSLVTNSTTYTLGLYEKETAKEDF